MPARCTLTAFAAAAALFAAPLPARSQEVPSTHYVEGAFSVIDADGAPVPRAPLLFNTQEACAYAKEKVEAASRRNAASCTPITKAPGFNPLGEPSSARPVAGIFTITFGSTTGRAEGHFAKAEDCTAVGEALTGNPSLYTCGDNHALARRENPQRLIVVVHAEPN
ncbi:MAG: hypothetical protein SFW62_03640 [Alphaproteobacteria bacterium]|nr:hypothetical protein [Alphaproteobacteria bacterium]